jgi:hypothetical protein
VATEASGQRRPFRRAWLLPRQLAPLACSAAFYDCARPPPPRRPPHAPPSGALMGNFDFSKGVEMQCRHEREELIWEALISLPWQPEYKYK